MKKIFAFFLTLFLVSCGENKPTGIIIENNNLSPKVIDANIKEVLAIDKMCVSDSLLVLINRQYSPSFYVFHRDDYSFVGSFGVEGNGPDDFLFPFFLNTDIRKDGILQVYDVNNALFKDVNLQKALVHESGAVRTSPIPPLLIGSPNLIQQNDSIFLGNMDNGKGLFFFYNKKSNVINWVDFPDGLLPPVDGDFTVMNMNRIACHSGKGRVVSTLSYYNRLLLYDLNGVLLKDVQIGNETIKPSLENKFMITPESRLCSTDIQCSDNYCYVLAQDMAVECYESPGEARSRIIVLDWDLNYVMTYLLPHYARTFVLDELNGRIIYTAFTSDGNTEVYYIESKL